MRAALALAAVLATVSPALGEAGVCDGFGLPFDQPPPTPELRVVARDAAKRVRFVEGRAGGDACPGASAACASKRFVTPGDPVVVAGSAGGYACAIFTGPAPKMVSTAGFLPAGSLSPAPVDPAPDWTGSWRSGDEQKIAIKRGDDGKLTIEGDASWGGSDPDRVARGGVNMGSVAGVVAQPRGAFLAFAMGDNDRTLRIDAPEARDACQLRLWRLGPYLAVADNGMCGGHNVTFSGVYRRG